ncbi:MAG TPA: MarR family transcriptional regulator [Candidatus Nanoarchaeia archaeon]|nr:MarR family transcriptional regulator [Candidatus Nanoarchaeia archaeon]
MDNKKIGGTLIGLSLAIGSILIYFISNTNAKYTQMCNPSPACSSLTTTLNLSHLSVGIFAAILSLGIYLIFFNKTEEVILRRLEEEKNSDLKDEKFNILTKALNQHETKVLSIVKEQPGITQNTLRLKADLSKSLISQILSNLEKVNIIKREAKGKTYSIFLTEEF